jgi:hypothetical protein
MVKDPKIYVDYVDMVLMAVRSNTSTVREVAVVYVDAGARAVDLH